MKDKDFENKVKEIVKVDDNWIVKSTYGETHYYTFGGNTYCISKAFHKNNSKNTYCVSKYETMLYFGTDENEAIHTVALLAEMHNLQ